MSVGRNVTLILALAFISLATGFGCQGEDAQGGSTSGPSGVTVQVGTGVATAGTGSSIATLLAESDAKLYDGKMAREAGTELEIRI